MKDKQKWEYGDFQTPPDLALNALKAVRQNGFTPKSVIEPTCGKGAFLLAALDAFPDAEIIGVDINATYLAEFEKHINNQGKKRIRTIHGDFFQHDWDKMLATLPDPILIMGNPPWVTSSELAALESSNVPEKSNFQKRKGYDAITGKSNFDISEWMLLQYLEWLRNRGGIIAVLCKTTVARKVLLQAWKSCCPLTNAQMFLIDTQKHFAASVEACFLVVRMSAIAIPTNDCVIFDNFENTSASRTIGYHDGLILSNVPMYSKWKHLRKNNTAYTWRSGIKHDCSNVMELEPLETGFRNLLGEIVKLEDPFVFPMLKSSDIANATIRYGRKFMVVTQRLIGEETDRIKNIAPKTWQYLEDHREAFSKRASSIYRNRPKYSIFGVGDYSFSPWKIAISGFHKNLKFTVIGSYKSKPVVFDDTVYFLPCWSRSEAEFIHQLLVSQAAQQFLDSMIFWSDKRPITIELLKRLDLHELSKELGCERDYLRLALKRRETEKEATQGQLPLGIA